MKKTILFATIVLTIATFVGCKKDETTTSTPSTCTFNNTSLVGTWKFSNVKDSTGLDILDKVDNCVVDMNYIFTKDSVMTTKCGRANINFPFKAVTINNTNKLVLSTDSLEVSSFDCKNITYKQFLNRSGRFVGTAFYSFTKQ
jgi:hypothetical protein